MQFVYGSVLLVIDCWFATIKQLIRHFTYQDACPDLQTCNAICSKPSLIIKAPRLYLGAFTIKISYYSRQINAVNQISD